MIVLNSSIICLCFCLFADILCFDNSFSWTRTKKIYYSCEVMISDEIEINTEINDLIENGDWETLAKNFETTHL